MQNLQGHNIDQLKSSSPCGNDGRRFLNQINDMCVKNKSAAALSSGRYAREIKIMSNMRELRGRGGPRAASRKMTLINRRIYARGWDIVARTAGVYVRVSLFHFNEAPRV